MHWELGKVLIYPEICTLIYSDFPSGASELGREFGIGVGTGVGTPAGVGTPGGPGGVGRVARPDFIRQKKLRRDPAELRKLGELSVLMETPVFMSIRRSRGP